MGTVAQKWEYMDLCPDTDAGYTAMLQAGEEGWEAACAWVEVITYYSVDAKTERRVNHILYKRPV